MPAKDSEIRAQRSRNSCLAEGCQGKYVGVESRVWYDHHNSTRSGFLESACQRGLAALATAWLDVGLITDGHGIMYNTAWLKPLDVQPSKLPSLVLVASRIVRSDTIDPLNIG